MRQILLPLLITLASPLSAQDWAERDDDVALDRAQVLDLTDGATLVFYDDGQSRFSQGGAYSYTYADGGGTAYGVYRVGEDGTVCITYRNGRSRCDRYVRSGDRVVMLTERGQRFPVRP